MKRVTGTDQACGVAAATTAHHLNDEFTVILNSAANAILALEPDHPARAALDELAGSVQRCISQCSDLLLFTARRGVRPARAPLAALMES